LIYLDSAATSLYKPESVQSAVLDAVNSMASPGRGAHAPAMRAAECCYACRERLAELFHVPDPEQVVFTFNATHALNIAIGSLVRKGTRVMISGYEHNSVTRPLYALGAETRVIATPLFDPERFLAEAERALSWAEVAVCTHVSNAFGYILPVGKLAELCRKHAVPLIIDASQSAGALDIDFSGLGAEFVCMPGHKGLMGPQGTGVLLCKSDAFPLLYGGSGSQSKAKTMPDFLPDRLEAGTHNVAGIAGLLASVEWILRTGTAEIRRREQVLLKQFLEELSGLGCIRLYDSPDPGLQAGVVSAVPVHMTPEDFAEALGAQGVAVRCGLHCAPAAHDTVGTSETGTVRFSFSPFNTEAQIARTGEIIKKILN